MAPDLMSQYWCITHKLGPHLQQGLHVIGPKCVNQCFTSSEHMEVDSEAGPGWFMALGCCRHCIPVQTEQDDCLRLLNMMKHLAKMAHVLACYIATQHRYIVMAECRGIEA